MKKLDQHNINALSKILYQTNIMPSADSRSFSKLSKKIILDLQKGYDYDKLNRVIESELIVTYGLSVSETEVNEITEMVCSWYND